MKWLINTIQNDSALQLMLGINTPAEILPRISRTFTKENLKNYIDSKEKINNIVVHIDDKLDDIDLIKR